MRRAVAYRNNKHVCSTVGTIHLTFKSTHRMLKTNTQQLTLKY